MQSDFPLHSPISSSLRPATLSHAPTYLYLCNRKSTRSCRLECVYTAWYRLSNTAVDRREVVSTCSAVRMEMKFLRLLDIFKSFAYRNWHSSIAFEISIHTVPSVPGYSGDPYAASSSPTARPGLVRGSPPTVRSRSRGAGTSGLPRPRVRRPDRPVPHDRDSLGPLQRCGMRSRW